jgi:osmoprotectant transport system permease protein
MSYLLRNPDVVLRLLGEHLVMTGISLVISVAIALPLSLLIYRNERLNTLVMSVLGVFYTIPSIALIILLIPLFGLNATSVVVALIIYTQVILVRNFTTGLHAVDGVILEAAHGMGMSVFQVWWRVQLPLALPVMLAGVRIAAVVSVAVATVGARFGAGGLGTILFEGVTQTGRYDKIWAGAISVSSLALVINWGLARLEAYFDPKHRMRARSMAGEQTA